MHSNSLFDAWISVLNPRGDAHSFLWFHSFQFRLSTEAPENADKSNLHIGCLLQPVCNTTYPRPKTNEPTSSSQQSQAAIKAWMRACHLRSLSSIEDHHLPHPTLHLQNLSTQPSRLLTPRPPKLQPRRICHPHNPRPHKHPLTPQQNLLNRLPPIPKPPQY